MAIGISITKAEGEYEPERSKFFGAPVVPVEWYGQYGDSEIFFCQINLEDVAELDKEDILPHYGYLYVFLDTVGGKHALRPIVRYCPDEPSVVIDNFNEVIEGFEYTDEWLMEFYEADDSEECTRLLGVPSDWNYEEAPPMLLMQYDPLDCDTDFLSDLDGFLYLFFGEDMRRFSDVTLMEERS